MLQLEEKTSVKAKSYHNGPLYRIKLVQGPLDGETYKTSAEPKEVLVLRSVPKMEEIFNKNEYVLRAATGNDYVFMNKTDEKVSRKLFYKRMQKVDVNDNDDIICRYYKYSPETNLNNKDN